MKKLYVIILLAFILSGCLFTRTVYVPHGQAVRLRETEKNVKVWVKTKDGKTIPGRVDLHEGWYCLPMEE